MRVLDTIRTDGERYAFGEKLLWAGVVLLGLSGLSLGIPVLLNIEKLASIFGLGN